MTFDFWDQLAAYERLEELRMFRPGVYKGLPEWQVRQQDAADRA